MNNIRAIREKLGMTQTVFAKYCGLSAVSVCRYEAGENISRGNAEKVAHACRVSVDYVLNRLEYPAESGRRRVPEEMLTVEEKSLLENFRRLNSQGKMRARSFVSDLLNAYPKRKKKQ